MSERKPKILLEDMLMCCNKINTYIGNMTFDEFMADDKTIDAVIRNFEILGEAANRLPEEFKDKFPLIDWYRIRGFRNRIVHDYMGIDFGIVWNIKEYYLPVLYLQILDVANE